MALAAYKFITIPEAQSIVLSYTKILPPESVPLADACGRILAKDVIAPEPLPPFPASIKDGYAVRSSDGVGEYPVIGEARAGSVGDFEVTDKTVAYITTGAPVPAGADAVVQVEDTEKLPDGPNGEQRVKILKAAKPGLDIRQIGSDIAEGSVVLSAGTRVGPAEMGILATVGAAEVSAFRRPKVAVLSNGDEVMDPGSGPLGPGQVRDANRAMLLAAAASQGAVTVDLGIARDTEGHLEGCVQRAVESGVDVLITSGGVSMGDRDLIKPLLERAGEVHFGKVRMKPGKPLTFATLDLKDRRMLVFALPGNPVSSLVCFHLVVRLSLRRMAGAGEAGLRRVQARLTRDVKMDPERPEYHRVSLFWGRWPENSEGEMSWQAVSTGNQISSRLLSARSANALLEIPRAEGVLPVGSLVSALLIEDLQDMESVQQVPATPGF